MLLTVGRRGGPDLGLTGGRPQPFAAAPHNIHRPVHRLAAGKFVIAAAAGLPADNPR